MAYDLIIRNGRIIDGTGAAEVRGDLAIEDGCIAAVGSAPGKARREIDAGGHCVTPGFIDVHAHDDAAVVREPAMDFKIMQGVTTDVVGNCGAGVAPANEGFKELFARGFGAILGDLDLRWTTTADYFAAVDAAAPACNVAAYVPHGVVRANVLGLGRVEADDAAMDAMKALVEEAMEAGAIGMSTGLIYPPGAWARTPEIIELAKVVAQHGGIYTSHIRNEGDRLLEAVDEALEIGEKSGCPVQISHHKSGGVPGGTLQSLPHIAAARERGISVDIDVYPYTASSSALAAMFRIGGRVFETVPALIGSVKYNKEKYEGKYISQIAEEMDLPVNDAIKRLLDEEENTPSVIMFIMHEDDVRRVVADPHAMIGSDGLPTGGKPHPRLYGTFPRVLQQYVREQPVLTLQDAVRKMTSLPAAKHRLKDRGVLREGAFADVVIFDPETIEDVATYTDPCQYPAGISHVIVNGAVTVEAGAQTDARAGRMLRRDA